MHEDIGEFARAILLTLAPAFQLSGITAVLGVTTGWLAGIVDRGRSIAEGQITYASQGPVSIGVEKYALGQRRHLTSIAFTMTAMSELLVCVVIAALSVEVMLETSLKWPFSAFFAAAMFTLFVGLIVFMRAVHFATRTVCIAGPDGVAWPPLSGQGARGKPTPEIRPTVSAERQI